jgi:hypothetical protein
VEAQRVRSLAPVDEETHGRIPHNAPQKGVIEGVVPFATTF